MNAVILSGRNEIIAMLTTELKSGESVQYGYVTIAERINADRELNLLSARTGKISYAKKYINKTKKEMFDFASEINEKEFLIN